MFERVTRGSRLLAAMVAAIFALPAAAHAFVRPGDLDTTFVGTGLGTLGTVQTAVGDPPPLAEADSVSVLQSTEAQPDPKVLVAGSAKKGGHKVFALVRYNSDGTVDSSFGTSGVVTLPVGDGDAAATTLLVRPDGYLVVAGWAMQGSDQVFAVTMLTPRGGLDTAYGNPTTHTVLTPVGTPTSGSRQASIQALQLGPFNSVLAMGWALDGSVDKLALVDYDELGTLHTDYGPSNTGMVLTDDGSGGALRGFAMQPAPDGGVYVAGDTGDTGPWAFLRYDPDGGVVRRVLTPVGDGGSAHATAMYTQTDGQFVVAGRAKDSGTDRFALARYGPTGDLDSGFGSGGKVITPLGTTAKASGVTEVFGREIVASGDATVSGVRGFALASYDMGGALDPSFGSGGTVFTPFLDSGGNPVDNVFGTSSVQQVDTNLVVAGGLRQGASGKIALARYITNVPGSSGGGLQGPFGGVLGTQASGTGGGRAGILIGRAKVRGRTRATVRLKCVRAAVYCKGRLVVRMKRRVGHRHKVRRFTVASVTFKVKSNKTGTLKLRLSHRAAVLLRKKHRLRAAASAKAKDAAGHTYRDAVGLTLKQRRRHKH
jgi:uncharacterized delta-60 repeat protein